jgi:hypothetical protein
MHKKSTSRVQGSYCTYCYSGPVSSDLIHVLPELANCVHAHKLTKFIFALSGETDEAIIRSRIDLDREPWPKVSDNAKDLVSRMLDKNPYARLTA